MVYFLIVHFGIKNFNRLGFMIIIITYLLFGAIHFLINRKNKFYYIDKNFSIIFLLIQIANPISRTANESFESAIIFNSIVFFIYVAFLRFYYLEMKSFKQKNQFLFQ